MGLRREDVRKAKVQLENQARRFRERRLISSDSLAQHIRRIEVANGRRGRSRHGIHLPPLLWVEMAVLSNILEQDVDYKEDANAKIGKRTQKWCRV